MAGLGARVLVLAPLGDNPGADPYSTGLIVPQYPLWYPRVCTPPLPVLPYQSVRSEVFLPSSSRSSVSQYHSCTGIPWGPG